ncbi:hypothetical protein OKW34_000258 [Paraburkholderia youngii]
MKKSKSVYHCRGRVKTDLFTEDKPRFGAASFDQVELVLTSRIERNKAPRGPSFQSSSSPYRSFNPKYIHDAFDVVGQYLKAHFGVHSP